jgi:hypothetical protein
MDVDIVRTASEVLPYLAAAARAYGGAIVGRVADQSEDAAADATVRLGRRLLRRFVGTPHGDQVAVAVTDLANHPDDADFAAAVRVQLRKALAADGELARQVAELVASASNDTYQVTVTHSQGFQIGHHNSQTNTM